MTENTTDDASLDEPADDTPDRTLSWWPLLAAVVVAAVFLTIIFTVGSDGDSGPGTKRDNDGALSCPSQFENTQGGTSWVPAKPSGVDGNKALVPDTKPSHVTVCAYRVPDPSRTARVKLMGHRTLTDGLRSLTSTLTHAPKAKGKAVFISGPNESVYLMGLTFATGFVWLSVPEGSAATNGQFVTNDQIHDRVADAYRTRAWK